MPTANRKVQIHYAGTLENGIDFVNTWLNGGPVEVTIGDGVLLPSLERELASMERGERRTVKVPMERAYGPYLQSNVVELPRTRIPHSEALPVGSYVTMQTNIGQVRVKIAEVKDDVLVVDCNHELAGHDLVFEIEVVHDESETLVDLEMGSTGCGCGCDKLKSQLLGDTCGCGHDL